MTGQPCECGCGLITSVATKTSAREGVRMGQARRFIKGHRCGMGTKNVSWRGGMTLHSSGYMLVRDRENPRAQQGYVFEHVLVAERALGRALPSGAVVHHVNEHRSDNRNNNLAVLQNRSEHLNLHYRLRVLRAGGDPWRDRICCVCKAVKPSNEFYTERCGRYDSRYKPCSRAEVATRAARERSIGILEPVR